MPVTPTFHEISFIYNSNAALKFGDTYQLDFAGLMQSLSVSHSTWKKDTYDMLGFTFNPRFTLPASSLTSPVTESVLEIELESRYYSSCLGVDSVFSGDGVDMESGIYYSHYSDPAVTNANTRVLCGQYDESYSNVKLRVTDYGQFSAGTTYYFRFPLIKTPSGDNSPLTYHVRLLKYDNSEHHPVIIGEYSHLNLGQTSNGNSYQTQQTRLSWSSGVVQNTMSLTTYYTSYNAPNGAEIAVKFKNDAIEALTSLATLTSRSQNNYGHYEYYPNINLCVWRKTTSTNDRYIDMGTYTTSTEVKSFTISFVYAYHSSSTIYYSDFNPGTSETLTLSHISTWSSTSFIKNSGWLRTNSMGIYTISFNSGAAMFPEGSYMKVSIDSQFAILDDYCKSMGGFVPGSTLDTSNLICRRNGVS